ncbi:hypothetical protein TRAPUB_12869 [Trametes pubescens]|uniref:Ricin B lectin domain-containing protein n=1 Tax=Trametes pubescens TaxID=154538 RepID=A0A1M2VSN7_TRAPU|nr:hypothetical protein TRAPUB_12869 [Trametes pubescens]
MPHLQSLSIRLRGHRTDKSSSTTTSSSHTFKHFFFHRERKTEAKSNGDKTQNSKDKMGNAPSDMNSRTSSPRERLAQLTRAATDTASVRSASAMPGAEPPTPVPAIPALSPPLEPWRSPSSEDEVRVRGYDVQDIPHIQNPTPGEESDLGTGLVPLGGPGSFAEEEPTLESKHTGNDAPEQILSVYQDAEPQVEPDAVTTPRAAVKSEEALAPVEEVEQEHAAPPGLEHHTAHHESEASDTTAVSARSGAATPAGGVWTPGTYVLLNARSGTAVDMSGADNKTLIGYPMHGGPNQQWEFIPSGHGYVIRCVRRSKEGHPLYLTTEAGLRENAAIVASPYPVSWNVEHTDEGIRISWPNTDFVFDLAEWGSNTPGTRIQLVRLKPGEPCQLWHYTRCAPADEHDKEVEVRSARAVSPPATTETVSVTEERDHITTTRTTTTTTISTVTEVTRMPRWMLLHARPQSPNRRSIGYRLA